jgi:hypothetical protein
VRPRDHIALSTAGAALLAPRLGLGAMGLWAGGVLMDVDHYAWYCIRRKDLSPLAAAHFFGGAHPPQTSATRALHNPIAVLTMAALAARQRRLRPLALGMTLHVGLDARHEARMRRARAEALARDRFLCRSCGTQTRRVDTHLFRQPLLLPSYAAGNLISLCGACHEAAHNRILEVGEWN